MIEKRNFVVKLDLFPGFYESDLENSDTSYCAIEEEVDYLNNECGEEITADDLDFDYEQYQEDVTEEFIEGYKTFVPDVVEELAYHHMWSPKYYNFATDEIYCSIRLAENWEEVFKSFMKENKEWLANRIKEDWSSCDGFISYMENRLEVWYYKLFEELDERYVGAMITYMMSFAYWKKSHKEEFGDAVRELRWELCAYALEDVYTDSYVYKIKDREEAKETE